MAGARCSWLNARGAVTRSVPLGVPPASSATAAASSAAARRRAQRS